MSSRGRLQGVSVSVAVTRPKPQAPELVRLLAGAGASPVEVPLVEITDADDAGQALRAAVAGIDEYDWVVLTSRNGAERFCGALGDAARLGGVQLAAVGRATAAVLQQAGLNVALVPEQQVAEGLLDAFATAPAGGGRLLLPRAAQGSDVFSDGARRKGWVVDDVASYQTVAAQVSGAQLETLAAVDVVTFTSSSAVAAFVELFPVGAETQIVACIGPSTAATARGLGLKVQVQAADHSLEGLVDALGELLGHRL